MNQVEINDRSGGLSDISRKKLVREVSTSEQNLSSVIKRLVHPHIYPELLESGGVFTVLGLDFMRELFSLQSCDGEALGIIRKRFILQSATSDRFQTLYKSWKPTVDMEIELPPESEPQLSGAITRYQQATIATVETLPLPDFTKAVETQSLTRLQAGLYQMYYRKMREVASTVAATAISDALADTLSDTEDALAFQMGEPS